MATSFISTPVYLYQPALSQLPIYTSTFKYIYAAGGVFRTIHTSDNKYLHAKMEVTAESDVVQLSVAFKPLYAWAKNSFNISEPNPIWVIDPRYSEKFILYEFINEKFYLDDSSFKFSISDTTNIDAYIITESVSAPDMNSPDWITYKPISVEILPFGEIPTSGSGITSSINGNNIKLGWDNSTDSNIVYEIHRKSEIEENFTNISGTGLPFGTTSFIDPSSDINISYDYIFIIKSLGVASNIEFGFRTEPIRIMYAYGKLNSTYITVPISAGFIKLTPILT